MANQFTDQVFKARFEDIFIPNGNKQRRVMKSDIKLVAFALAWRMNDKNVCWPSLNTIAEDTGLNPRTVSYVIKAMEQVRILVVVSGNTNKSNRYMLRLEFLQNDSATTVEQPSVPTIGSGVLAIGSTGNDNSQGGTDHCAGGVLTIVQPKASLKASLNTAYKSSIKSSLSESSSPKTKTKPKTQSEVRKCFEILECKICYSPVSDDDMLCFSCQSREVSTPHSARPPFEDDAGLPAGERQAFEIEEDI